MAGQVTRERESGWFGPFGGRYVAPSLLPVLRRVDAAFHEALEDRGFQAELGELLSTFVGRPTPLYRAKRLLGNSRSRIYLKREDLAATGGSYINSALGQCLIARRLGARVVISDTGSGHNGIATAAAAARLGLHAVIFMAEDDCRAYPGAVERMAFFGAEVRPVQSNEAVLSEAVGAAHRAWMGLGAEGFYVAGAPLGPHPYPTMVRTFQALVGVEVSKQLEAAEGRAPDIIVSSLGGGGTALGLFAPFLDKPRIRFVATEIHSNGRANESRLQEGSPGIIHGAKTLVFQDSQGRVQRPSAAKAPGMRYPALAPEVAWLWKRQRIDVAKVTDEEAAACQVTIAHEEGILVAIEACYGIAAAVGAAMAAKRGSLIVSSIVGTTDLNGMARPRAAA
jgi:tryptophan synthase beta chain